MTASGITHVQTPIAGLVELALRDPSLADVARRAADRPGDLTLVGPASARVFAASALAQAGPLLVVTATGREADDLTAELRGVLGDAVAMFPSWETLPHERLSPGVDTVGARLMVLRRLAHPDDERLGPPLRVVVTTTRSLLQPMAPDLADIEPVTLTVGAEAEFDDRRSRGSSTWPTPASTWSASAASSRCAAASSTSSRRPPSIRCASSSGATRSPRCGCSPSPTSGPSPRSPSTR